MLELFHGVLPGLDKINFMHILCYRQVREFYWLCQLYNKLYYGLLFHDGVEYL